MSVDARLRIALQDGLIALPSDGRIAVIGPMAGMDLCALPRERCDLISTFRPDTDYFERQNWTCRIRPEGRYALVLVIVARSRALTLMRLAQAAAICDGSIIVDGAKTDGVEALLKACRGAGETSAALSKAHGKAFTFNPGAQVAAWASGEPSRIDDTYMTAPGVFSSDGIDPASALLAAQLPRKLGRQVADLGAGWGYLAAQALERSDIDALHLVEAEHAALECARQNVADPRAVFHWADATRWQAPTPIDALLMNPPFHVGRSGEPAMGQAFIAAAARQLAPRGTLYMVANRHLPYEAELHRVFGRVESIGDDSRFKIFVASRPARTAR
ncbi:MAG: methyltransferase [Pseudomonadota bacterium]